MSSRNRMGMPGAEVPVLEQMLTPGALRLCDTVAAGPRFDRKHARGMLVVVRARTDLGLQDLWQIGVPAMADAINLIVARELAYAAIDGPVEPRLAPSRDGVLVRGVFWYFASEQSADEIRAALAPQTPWLDHDLTEGADISAGSSPALRLGVL